MGTLFRIKIEAQPFFESKYLRKCKPLSYWKENQISELALEKVDDVWISFGIPTSKTGTSLSGWSSENDEVKFYFTLNAFNVSNKEYEKLKKEANIDFLITDIEDLFRSFIQKYKC